MSYRDVFGEVLADHHESPRFYGQFAGTSQVEHGFNPLCGDRVDLYVQVEGQKLARCQFEGEGCSICMASASILAERIQGMAVSEVLTLIEAFRKKMAGAEMVEGLPAEDAMDDDLVALYGVKRFPVRIKCALLAWTTLKKALGPEAQA
jgi:nitrogen fixation protein NifU and related proteins